MIAGEGHFERATPAKPALPAPVAPRQIEAKKAKSHGWVWLLILAAIGVAGYFAYPYLRKLPLWNQSKRPAAETPTARAVPVVTAVAKKGEMKIYLNGLGTVTPLNTVTVRSRVDGQIVKIGFVEGQLVHEGQTLIEIDPRPFQVQVAQAEGQLARDEAQLKNARLDLQRYKTLFEQNFATEQQVATQQALVNQIEGTIKSDQAQIDNAKLQMVYSRITAPITGRIGFRLVDLGNMVHASDVNGLAVITQLQPISLVFTLPQDDIPAVRKAMRIDPKLVTEAFSPDLKTKLASGVLLTVDNQIDPSTGTVKLKSTFANEDDSLFANQFVNARLLVQIYKGAIIVPAAAVQRGPQGTFVYVVKSDSTVELRDVAVGPTEGDETAIDSGLAAGESVVTDGVDKLQKGSKVSVAKAGATQPTTRRGTTTRGATTQSRKAQSDPATTEETR